MNNLLARTENMVLRLLKMSAGVTGVLLIGWLMWTEDLSWIAFVFTMGAICAVVLIRWPYGGLLALVAASALPRLSVGIHGWNAKPEHLAVLLVTMAFIVRWTIEGRQRIPLTRPDLCVIGYVAVNYLSSVLESPEPGATLKWAVLNNLVVLPYFLVRFLVVDQKMLRWLFNAFLGTGIAVATYGVICFVSHLIFKTTFGVDTEQYGYIPATYGTQYEANLLGSYAGCVAIMLLVLYFLGKRRSHWPLPGIVIALAALLVSLSRGAFIAFAFALLVSIVLGLKYGMIKLKKLIPLAAALFLFVVLAMPITVTYLSERFSTLSQGQLLDDQNTLVRLVSYVGAAQDILQHPLIGNGTASFQLMAGSNLETYLGSNPWVGNSPIRILHDTGLAGLILFGLFIVGVAKQVKRVLMKKGREAGMVIALSVGCTLYAISFQATDGTLLAFFWVHIGLLASATAPPENWAFQGVLRNRDRLAGISAVFQPSNAREF